MKIEASRLLMANVGNTFTTPVFNGSTSLRDAAGQMIEDTTKSVRRKKEVNDAFIEKLYADVTSLYRLDQIQTDSSSGRQDFGPLPQTSAALLAALAFAWACIIAYVLKEAVKKKKSAK